MILHVTRSQRSRSNKASKLRQVGSHQCRVASFKYMNSVVIKLSNEMYWSQVAILGIIACILSVSHLPQKRQSFFCYDRDYRFVICSLHRLQFYSQCHTKRKIGRALSANPSFGMIATALSAHFKVDGASRRVDSENDYICYTANSKIYKILKK